MNLKHGLKEHYIYRIWDAIIERCENPNSSKYTSYGGRGIKICSRWRNSVVDFYHDMGDRPSHLYSIERINNNGDYEPNNCRWATTTEQSRNKRNNVLYEYNGRSMILPDWAKAYSISVQALRYRIKVAGWSFEKALTTPLNNINQEKGEVR